MWNSHQVLLLYTRILEEISFRNQVNELDMKQAINRMHQVYQTSTNDLSKELNCLTDYNVVAYRCAYLFKYAPFHTALAYKTITHALTQNPLVLQSVLDSLSGPLKLCSLGGGPGTDVIGVIAAIHDKFGFFPISAKIVDIMSEWKLTFSSVVQELRFGEKFYGSLSQSVNEKWFDWSFIAANLQSKMSKELTRTLATADIITMVKFVSAAACKETSTMIENIFRIMKPGAFLLFVDNAGGGFEQLISNVAIKYKLKAVFEPLKHQHYINETFLNIKYGYRSCYESKVAVQLLMKCGSMKHSNKINLAANLSYEEQFSMPICQELCVPEFQNFGIDPNLADNLVNEYDSSNWHRSNSSPRQDRFEIQFDSPINLHKSIESDSFWSSSPHNSSSPNWPVQNENQNYDSEYQNMSFGQELSFNNGDFSCDSRSLPLNSTPQVSPFQRRSVRTVDLVYDSSYENELIECRVFWNASANNSLLRTPNSTNNSLLPTPISASNSLLPTPISASNSLLPTPIFPTISESRFNATEIDNSDYPNESFESGLPQDSAVYNSPLPFRKVKRLVRFNESKGKTNYSFNEECSNQLSIWNTPVTNIPQHFTFMHHDVNSSLPIPYEQNFLELNQNRISFRGIENLDICRNAMNSESSLHTSWSGHCHLSRNNQSKNKCLSMQRLNKHRGKNKASRRQGIVSKHRYNPYKLKKFHL